ncbi:hypothetical protein CK228_18185 [Mesorhizobium sp. WSM4312]|uniref:hypothetical protein n=1 Tax=Mesorhizobium sp. WSM4312 TaxID=2029411 RepID=UPI000BAF36DC|nr:hypothetical protein [Mesorhizobium sp. WSM4312]PBB67118.1 hypothetical protein CK228_18185 [Mesorhizobium sp. WSM4312]
MPRPYIKRAALYLALRLKPPVSNDPFDDDPARGNFFVNYLHEKDGRKRFIVRDVDTDGVSGLWFDEDGGNGQPKKLTNEELKEFSLSFVHHYLGAPMTTYGNLFAFFWGVFTFYPLRRRWWDKLAQDEFNRKPLIRSGRLEVLRFFLNQTVKRGSYRVSSVSLMADLFSMRFFGHPEEEETSTYYELVLRSLVHSKDLQTEDHEIYYSLSDQGLTTLSGYEEEERRHRGNLWLQALIVILTLATVGVAIWQEYHPDPPEAPPSADRRNLP